MPGMDGTGPYRNNGLTGRGLGFCGRGFSNYRGASMLGRGATKLRCWFNRLSSSDESMLRKRADYLEEELKNIKQMLGTGKVKEAI